MVENYGRFLTTEIYPATYYLRVQLMQVFEQVQATAAMYLRQVKGNMGFLIISKIDKSFLDVRLVEKCEFILTNDDPLAYSRCIVQIVIFAQPPAIQQLVNHLATFAAKMLFAVYDTVTPAAVAAMIAGRFLTGGYNVHK